MTQGSDGVDGRGEGGGCEGSVGKDIRASQGVAERIIPWPREVINEKGAWV